VPDCGEHAPVSVSALLPASLDKLLGIYLLARVVRGLFVLNANAHMLLMLIGAGTVIGAVMMALVQHDLKRLLSYHAVSQVGYMVLGIASGTAVGFIGGLFHMLNNAIYKTTLFMCAGAVEKQAGTTDLDKLGGLARGMPMTFSACLVAVLAISGVPPLNGFASKWMVYQGIIQSGADGGPWVMWLAAAMIGSALTLASFVKVLHAAFLRKPATGSDGETGEAHASMWGAAVTLAVLCVLFGIFWFRAVVASILLPLVAPDVVFSGTWAGGPATVLLVCALAVGAAGYWISSARKPRVCETYIGGEKLTEADLPGVARGSGRDVEVTGVDFYRTIETMAPFSGFYRRARQKHFDPYDVGTRVVFYFVELLRAAHTGRLTTYVTWLLAGLLFVIWLLV
jgi:formate hydrogenlyase subunit 3/multisubunit Na+/H+ antiporter MnhD subunit